MPSAEATMAEWGLALMLRLLILREPTCSNVSRFDIAACLTSHVVSDYIALLEWVSEHAVRTYGTKISLY